MSAKVEPYRPPNVETTRHENDVGTSDRLRGLWLLAYLYPLALISSLYGTWLIAWWELGHMPRPSIDDPASIGGLMTFFYFLPLAVLMPFPIMMPLGFLASFNPWRRRSATTRVRLWWLWPAGYVLLCLCVFWMLRLDPFQVGNWYGD